MNSELPFICISLCEDNLESLQKALAEVDCPGVSVELRLDCLEGTELDKNLDAIDRLVETSKCPIILTLRPDGEGGRQDLDLESRLRFWSKQHPSTLLDLELDIVSNPSLTQTVDWRRVICSHHDYQGGAADILRLYKELAATPSRILKIAIHANDVTDCLPVFELLERARSDGREVIAIAMGSSGVVTRVLGPSRGSVLTYASLDDQSATAPGQLTVSALRDVYRIEKINRQTAIYGLVGKPVAHSLSPLVQNTAFESAGIDAVFLPFDVLDVRGFLVRMVHPKTREIDWNLRGLSVTAPHKATVMEQLDWIEPAAQAIGAVNTIVVKGDGLHGFNKDAEAFVQPIVRRLSVLKGLRCAVIGNGGAARSAVWGLKNAGADVTIFARNMVKADPLASQFQVALNQLDGAHFAGFDVVVNATPLGTAGANETLSVATAEQLRDAGLAYDLVYNPTETLFLRSAREAGCETLSGIEMFTFQAEAQFRLWTGQEAPEGLMRSVLKAKGKG